MSVRLDASGDYFGRTTDMLNYNSAYAIMGWFYPSAISGTSTVFCLRDTDGGNYDFFGWSNSTTWYFEVLKAGAGSSSTPAYGAGTGVWRHLAMVRESTTSCKVYDNGALLATLTTSVSGRSAINVQNVGYFSSGFPNQLNGRVAGLKAWSGTLTLAQVQAEMWRTRPMNTANLYSWWPVYPGATERLRGYGPTPRNWTGNGSLTDEAGPPLPTLWRQLDMPWKVAAGGGTTNTETGGAQSPQQAGGADQTVFTDLAGARSTAQAGAADQSVFAEQGQVSAPGVAGAADQSIFAESGGALSPAVAGGASQRIWGETDSVEAPSVAGGDDQNVFGETSTAQSPVVAGGTDAVTFTDLAGAQSPAVAGGADEAVFRDGGQATTTAQAGGAAQLIQRGREGETVSPAVAGGADAVTYTEQAGGYSPAVASGLDQLVYTETATATATGQAGGASQHIPAVTGDTGGAASPAAAAGADRTVFTEEGLGESAAACGGAVQHIRSGGASSGSWVPFGDHFAGIAGPDVTYGTSLKDRMKREQAPQPAAVLEDEALLMLL